jgi:hypothetical protein
VLQSIKLAVVPTDTVFFLVTDQAELEKNLEESYEGIISDILVFLSNMIHVSKSLGGSHW